MKVRWHARFIGLFLCVGLVVVGMTGCGSSGSQDPVALEGVQWALTGSSMNGVDLSKAGITAKFEGGQMSGFSGVNSYSGPYEADTDGSFKAGQIASTLMAGPEDLMAAEAAYLKLLEAAESFATTDGELTLTTSDGATLMFTAAKPFELGGSSWMVTGFNNGKEAVIGPVVDSELTLEFGTDGSVSGSSGVNNFSGTYEAAEDTIEIGPLASTKMMGPEELMVQEQSYLAALAASTTWEVSNGVLTMRDAAGATQIHAIAK